MRFQIQQLSEHIWLFPHNPLPNAVQSSIGVIATRHASVLIDAGNSPRLARKVKTELARRNFPPLSRIIYTHHHWDHVYGACEFGARVMAHVSCRAILEEESRKPWGVEFLRAEIKRNPKLAVSYKARLKCIEDWDAFRIIVPEEVFEKTKSLDLEGLAIELEHVGGQHAEDSIVVKVAEEGVMFLGDCYYPPPVHLRKPDSTPSFEMLRRLQDQNYRLYVEGHDKPFTRAELLKVLHKSSR